MIDLNNKKMKEQYKYYPFLSVLYAIFMVTAQAVAYRLIQIGSFSEPGGIFIFPATFVINDVIAEVYGPTLARRSIYIALFAQAFFTFVPMGVNALPYPTHWHHADAYRLVFGSSWLVFVSNLAAVMIGMILNTQIIGRTKLKYHGRYFTVRSLFSSTVGEFILTAIIVSIALTPVVGIELSLQLFLNMFLFKLIFTFLAVFPASIIVVAFKKLDNADVYEEHISFNPLSKFIRKDEVISKNLIDFYEVKKRKNLLTQSQN